MNLAELKDYLSHIDPKIIYISGRIQEKNPDGKYYYLIKGLDQFRTGINYLSKIDFLKPIISQIKETEIYKSYSDNIVVESSTKIDDLSLRLYHYLLGLKTFLDSEVTDEDPNAIRIKLPPVKDFEDVARVMNDLKKAISIPISDEAIGGRVEIEKAESGSIWLLVALGTPIALRLIAELCWAAKVIQRKEKENEFVAQQIREYDLNNQLRETLVNAQKQLVSKLLENEASNIQQQLYGTQLPEQTQRLILSITTFSELYQKGAEFHPSLSASESVANLFPSSKNQELLESKIKQLGEGSSSDTSTP